ncbi:pectinesterase-like [Lolium rigidum]|uniref:pectinesterase-like n=1 Tax=Lolium rigidum TaxID=89674 RepID=UPI001F5DE1F4|nr:pectinesterase-like [Lolium rigidum]
MNKKGAIIAGASAVLLVLAAVIVVVCVVFSKRNHHSSTGAAELPVSEKLLKAFCQPTDHRETCEAELSKAAAHARSPTDLTEAIFHVTSGKISEAISESKALIDALRNISKRTSRALHNCGELLSYAVDDLEATLARLQGEVHSVGDLKTWISAALTFQETCLDGLTDSAEATSKMSAALGSALELTDDILAVLDQLPVAVTLQVEEDNAVPNLVVELKPNMTVSSDGSGDFKTINEALAMVPRKSAQVYVLYVKAGVYREYVSVPSDVINLAMIGDGASKTVITGSRNFMMNLTTKDTATMEAIGHGFFMRDIKVENTAGPAKHQAVALRVQSDQAVFHRCTFDGFQDTLYAHAMRQFFRDCTISGTVDFIFGNSQAVLQNCLILARRPMDGQKNTVTAQGRRKRRSAGGTVLHNCTVAAHPDLLEAGTVVRTYLGRPWKEYSRTIYVQSELGALVDQAGWLPWNASSFALDTLFYAEVDNRGPGADTGKRVKWGGIRNLTYEEAQEEFTVDTFLQGQQFIPKYGVPLIRRLLPRSVRT